MKSIVLLITGKPRSGKDTFHLILKNIGYTVTNYSLADNAKEVCRHLGIEPKDKPNDYRKLLSDIKIALDNYNNFNLKSAINLIKHKIGEVEFICIQAREEKDINFIKNYFGDNPNLAVYSLLVVRDVCEGTYGNIADDNINFETDITIVNNDTYNDYVRNISNLASFLSH